MSTKKFIEKNASEEAFPLALRPSAALAESDWNAMVAFYWNQQPAIAA